MTAIAGLWNFDSRPGVAEGCAQILEAQKIYGLDDGAQWSVGDIALGRRLMRVLPEDLFDRQPLVGAGGRFVLVADLRLDNRDELADEMGLAPADARKLSDSEILLKAIERWEAFCVNHIIGDFAFALWDASKRCLMLARDPLGQRPLHYYRGTTFFAVASMPKGLYALRDVPKVPDGDRIAEFLAHIPRHGSQSYFRGIERVESGHVVIFSLTGLIARRYWQPNRKSLSLRRPDDYVDALRELLDRAVRCRLRGAEDVAVQLSGGLDSSGVAATAARQLAEVGHRVVAFTAVPRTGFNGVTPRNRIADEGPLAAATAAMYPNIEHVLIRTEGRTVLDDLDCGFLLYDEPVRNLCNNIWANCIYDAIRERKLTVLLVGNMGNLGLSYDGMELLPELFRQGQWIKLLLEGRALAAREGWRWSGFLKRTFAPWCPAPIWSLLNRMTSGDSGDVLNYSAILPTRFAELKLRMRASNHSFDLTGRSAKDSFTALRSIFFGFESGNGNKGALAGWHIDERDPTADIRLLEFCLAVPADQFLSDGIPRALGRRTLEDRIPKIVLEERSRGLQSADWYEGLTAARDQIAAELSQMDSCPAVARMIDLPRLRQLVEKWPSEGWERSDIINSYYFALVRAVSAGHFLRRASDDNS